MQRLKFQIVSNTGISLRRGLHESHRTANRTRKGKNITNSSLQYHGVSDVPDLLVNIKRLRVHNNFDFILALKLKEVTKPGIK